MARNMDFIIIPDNAAAAGMPNKRLLTTGDSTAVIRPTLMPYLYAPINVKKYIGRNIFPPSGMRWHSCGNIILPVTNSKTKR